MDSVNLTDCQVCPCVPPYINVLTRYNPKVMFSISWVRIHALIHFGPNEKTLATHTPYISLDRFRHCSRLRFVINFSPRVRFHTSAIFQIRSFVTLSPPIWGKNKIVVSLATLVWVSNAVLLVVGTSLPTPPTDQLRPRQYGLWHKIPRG